MAGPASARRVGTGVLIGNYAIIAGNAQGGRAVSPSPRPSERSLKYLVGEKERHLGEERVGDNDHDRGDHDGLRGGPPDALRSAAYGQSLVAAHRRENE